MTVTSTMVGRTADPPARIVSGGPGARERANDSLPHGRSVRSRKIDAGFGSGSRSLRTRSTLAG
jgi:hypothetical protein